MISKIRLLTQEQASVPHEFWEDSEGRRIQSRVRELMDADPQLKSSPCAFIGERGDGLWIWFFDAEEAAERLRGLL